MTAVESSDPQTYLDLDDRWCAHNYHPLPVVIASAEGAWVTDVTGKRYLDMLAGYSALNFGHRHPDLIAAAIAQMGRVTLTSRAFHHDQLGPFCAELAALTGTEMVLPMNSGAEAVESAIKVARKWSYRVKGVPENRAQIITAGGNFHGRTLTIVSFSDDSVAHDDYGPYTPGFVTVKYGDLQAMEAAITPDTAAILLEPIQGEAGVLVPPAGYLAGVRRLCDEHNVLFIADEIQSGLGRTGRTLALDHEGRPRRSLHPGQGAGRRHHAGLRGGRPARRARRAAARASTGRRSAAIRWPARSAGRSSRCCRPARCRPGPPISARTCTPGWVRWSASGLAEVRGRGLWAGAELAPHIGLGRPISEQLARRGILVKETHETTLRFAPPIVITRDEIDRAVDTLAELLAASAA